MARVIAKLPEAAHGGGERYPWDKWFDGRVWHLQRGVDFHTRSTAMFYAAAWSAAKRRKVCVKMRLRGNSVFIQRIKRSKATRPRSASYRQLRRALFVGSRHGS